MRVLHVQKVTGIGGSERHLLCLLPALMKRGIDAKVCVLASGNARSFVDELSRVGVPSTIVPAGEDINASLVPKLTARLRKIRPDLVHTHLVHGDLYGQLAASLLGIPGVSTMHGPRAFYRREPYRSAGRLSGQLAQRKIAISKHIAAFLCELRLCPPERIEVIPYGIDAGGWTLPAEDRGLARRRLGLEPDEIAIGIAARLIPGKGHRLLLDAVNRVAADEQKLRLLVAGTGPLRAELERVAASGRHPESIRFLGFVDDMRGFMNACDVIAFPTLPELGEGFGLAALEAMAVGRPVLATAVASLPELVVHGETGVLVSHNTPDELDQALAKLAGDAALREDLGNAGASRAREVFGLDVMVERTIALYESVL